MMPRTFSFWAPSAALLILLWLLVFNQQRLEWSVNVVYAYGWAVPVMAAYLLWERWRTRPVAEASPRWLTLALLGAAGGLLAAYLPVRIIQEANPDWVKINWSLAGLAVGLTWLAFAVSGGVRQARHFVFPLLFCFTALPWPVWLDNWLVQSLMRGNAIVCAELLSLFGTPAMAEGNLIQVAERWVNVEEACSGIRSLQTAFMMSLFLGELHRLPLLRRVGLVAASFGVAFLLNIVRTLLLTRLTVEDAALVERWHDPVGVVAMLLCLVALWGLSEWFRPGAGVVAVAPTRESAVFAQAYPMWFALVGGAWYAYHERRVPPAVAWEVVWPRGAPQFKRGEFAERTLALLKFNRGETATWQAEHAYPWQMYALHWNPGRVSKHLSSAHHPTVCLPATGLTLVRELGAWECVVNGVRLPFSTYLFAQGDQEVYVFHAIVEDRPLRAGESTVYRQVDTTERLRSVWRGERNLGQHVVGIALLGAASSEDAREIVLRVLGPVIRPIESEPALTSL
jgi:exosortase